MTVAFVDAKGLYNGDPVYVSGIKVGEIIKVYLSENNMALVNFYMDYTKLSPDTKFRIDDVGLMGDKSLVVLPGKSPGELDPNQIQTGIPGANLSDLVAEAQLIMNKLNNITVKIEKDTDISKLFSDVEQTMLEVKQTVGIYKEIARENRSKISGSIDNFEKISKDLKIFVDKNDEKISNSIESIQKTSDKFSTFISDMNKLSAVIDTITVYMSSGDGSLAKVLKRDELYEELRETNSNINDFITDFKKNPGKYTKDVKFRVRLF
jgi:ABC-type transporter Mla subunit MlaD